MTVKVKKIHTTLLQPKTQIVHKTANITKNNKRFEYPIALLNVDYTYIGYIVYLPAYSR